MEASQNMQRVPSRQAVTTLESYHAAAVRNHAVAWEKAAQLTKPQAVGALGVVAQRPVRGLQPLARQHPLLAERVAGGH